MPEIIILGLGTNLGNRKENLRKAITLLSDKWLKSIRQSNIYETEALLTDQAREEWDMKFLNMVITATLKDENTQPHELLQGIKEIEAAMGRNLKAEKWSPRIIDIDILGWGNHVIDMPGLKIPHIYMLERDFVIKPLAELMPLWKHPVTGKTIEEYAAVWNT